MTAPLNRRLFLTGMTAMAATAASAAPRKAAPFFAKPGRSIGLQVYMLGEEASNDPAAAFARLASIGYRDLELPSLMGKSAADLKAAADNAGVKFSCIHLGPGGLSGPSALNFDTGTQATVDALGTLGISDAVLPLALLPGEFKPAPGEDFRVALARVYQGGGADGWKRTAEAVNRKAAALSPHGITLGYHNHDLEFAPLGKTTGWEILLGELDRDLVALELDLGWVAAAGLDPAVLLRRYKGRVRWVHVKDIKRVRKPTFALGADTTPVGAGSLDWPRILRACEAAGVRHYYVEQEPPFAIQRFEAAERSYAFLKGVRA
jgi:sugar phosphate isomerase/epimerase